MAKLSVDDLEKIREKAGKERALSEGGYRVEITVHMGTCGIAAGAEQVHKALNEAIEKSRRSDIRVVISGCMGMCSSEPNVTVRRLGEDAVLYGGLDPEKMGEIFTGHVVNGEVQADLAVARIK